MRSEGVSLYKRVRISSVCEVFDGPHATPKKTDCGPVYLGIDSITDDGHINPAGFNHLSSEDFIIWTKRIVPKENDVVFTYEATLGRYALIPKDFYGCLGRRIALVRAKDDSINPRWLLYYFLSPGWKSFIESRTVIGSTVNRIPIKAFPDYEIDMPPRSIQDRIASILGDIDDRIENNKKINDNLLQQADLLFKSWFLDYAPWDGNIPESWISGKLGEYTEIKRGGSPRPIQEYLSDSGLRWLKISDVTSLSSPFVIDIKDHIIESGLRKTVLLSAGSLVLSNSATPGIPKILDVDSCIHDGWLYFPKSVFSKESLYLYFRYIRQQLVNLSNGSVFNNLKTDILKEYPTTLPDSETLHQFDEIVKPMFDRMQGCARESHKLAELRDALLPRLMSGEIDVSNITF